MKAPLYLERSQWTGKDRARCEECGKVAYPDEPTAMKAATQVSERVPMRHYAGACGHWHLTRSKRGTP